MALPTYSPLYNIVHCIPQGFPLKKIIQWAAKRDFTDLLVFNEDRKAINGLLIIHLPDGPTAHFKVSNVRLAQDIRVPSSF